MKASRSSLRPMDDERFRALIEHSLDVIALVNADGNISYVSPSIVRVLGYTPEEFIELEAFEVVHPDDRDEAIKRLASIVQQPGGSQTALNRVRHKDGSWRWIETVSTNELENPRVRAVVANFRDITDRKLAEEALKDADRRKDEFISMLAHELRNPLAAMSSALHVLRHDSHQEDIEWSKNMIERQTKNLTRMINDLLDVSRIDHGKIALLKRRMDLAQVITRAVEMVQPSIDQRRHTLTLSIASGPS